MTSSAPIPPATLDAAAPTPEGAAGELSTPRPSKAGRPRKAPRSGARGRPKKPASQLRITRITVLVTPDQHRAIKERAGSRSVSSYLAAGGATGWVRNGRLARRLDQGVGPIEKLLKDLDTAPPEMIERARRGCGQLRAIINNL